MVFHSLLLMHCTEHETSLDTLTFDLKWGVDGIDKMAAPSLALTFSNDLEITTALIELY